MENRRIYVGTVAAAVIESSIFERQQYEYGRIGCFYQSAMCGDVLSFTLAILMDEGNKQRNCAPSI